jgi:hypothetical protein
MRRGNCALAGLPLAVAAVSDAKGSLPDLFFPGPPGGREAFYAPFGHVVPLLHPHLHNAASTFRHNVDAVIKTAQLPYYFMSLAVWSRRVSPLYYEELKRLGVEPGDPEQMNHEAMRRASEQLAARPTLSSERQEEIGGALYGLFRQQKILMVGAVELLRQAATLTWTAFEVLRRDILAKTLKARPDLIVVLQRQKALKGRRLLKGDVESLGVLHLSVIRPAFDVLFLDPRLSLILESRNMLLLSERRHVIVHRSGIVDEHYLTNTDDQLQLGSELQITRQDLDAYLLAVRGAGIFALRAASTLL